MKPLENKELLCNYNNITPPTLPSLGLYDNDDQSGFCANSYRYKYSLVYCIKMNTHDYVSAQIKLEPFMGLYLISGHVYKNHWCKNHW